MSSNSILTQAERHCWQVLKKLQRRQLLADALAALSYIPYPHFFRRLTWPADKFSRFEQFLVVMVCWPLLVILAVLSLFWCWFSLPAKYVATFFEPSGSQSPGEKSLVGVHNAFIGKKPGPVMLSEERYIACLNEWVLFLYGEKVASSKSMDSYLAKLSRSACICKPLATQKPATWG